MKYIFAENAWKNDFSYAYSLVATSFAEFTQMVDHIHNGYNEEIGGYDYISLVHKERLTTGASVELTCSFDAYGAPLLTFANTLWTDGEGHLRYGEHYEVVAYENGCNVWRVSKAPEGCTRPFLAENSLRLSFPIRACEPFVLRATLLEKRVRVELLGMHFELRLPHLADEVYVGVTACEGINRFYELTINK